MSPVSASTPPKPGPVSKERTSGGSSDRSLDGMTLLISSGSIASRSREYFGCCSSNLVTCISVTALSWMVVSSVPVRNLTTSLLPPRLLPQAAAPRSAAPASPTPPNLRKSLRLTALGICRSLALLALVQRSTNDVCWLRRQVRWPRRFRSFLQIRAECAQSSLVSRESYDHRGCRAPTWKSACS